MSNADGKSSRVNKDTCLLSRSIKISFAVIRNNVHTIDAGMLIDFCQKNVMGNLQGGEFCIYSVVSGFHDKCAELKG